MAQKDQAPVKEFSSRSSFPIIFAAPLLRKSVFWVWLGGSEESVGSFIKLVEPSDGKVKRILTLVLRSDAPAGNYEGIFKSTLTIL